MDVRFYPAAAGSSLPGDPSNLDFAQCLGYYNYNKVIIPACVVIPRAAARAGSPRAGVRAPSGRGGAGLGDARGGGARPPVPEGPWDARPREGGGAGSSRPGRPAPPPSLPPAGPGRCLSCPEPGRLGSLREPGGPARNFRVRVPLPAAADKRRLSRAQPSWLGPGLAELFPGLEPLRLSRRPGGAPAGLGRPCEGGEGAPPSALLFRVIPALLWPVSN